ncbi:thioesterase [Caulobacter mirabilis]|uniref:Thioesterase n=2 Tax=Caulobacter mirabilis TaxID=69666 RepID=A0A2D2B3W2_9CAUL|nr:thioesterase [Caulobacter mirabilis]
MTAVPEGFTPHARKSPVTDAWEPLFSRRTDDALQLGLRVAEAHTNSRGFAHGGLISALADNAMGLSCGLGIAKAGGLVTVNLALDFLAIARIGQWLQVEPTVVKRGKNLCFASALVTADGVPCARANATFQIVQ